MQFEKRKFESLSKEELAKTRKVINNLVDKLGASNVQLLPMNEQDCEFIDKDVNGREYFNPFKK